MLIVNRETFMKLPPDTVFSKYEPCVFGDICIKGESSAGIDFYYSSIADGFDWGSTEEFVAILECAEKHGESVSMQFNEVQRDGFFDKEQLFAVWENKDVLALINRLKQCVK